MNEGDLIHDQNRAEQSELKEQARKALEKFQLAKQAKTEEEMVEHLKEFNTALVDILDPSPVFRRNNAHSRMLKDDDRDNMSTLATLKWVVTGKKVPSDVDTIFHFGSGSQGCRIVFKKEREDQQQVSEDGNVRWMVYHKPEAQDGKFAHEYWERFMASFGSEWVDLLEKLAE